MRQPPKVISVQVINGVSMACNGTGTFEKTLALDKLVELAGAARSAAAPVP